MKVLLHRGKEIKWDNGATVLSRLLLLPGFPVHTAICDLAEQQYNLLWQGNTTVQGIDDFFAEVEQNLYKVQYRVMLSRFRGKTLCPTCKGYRLRPEAMYIKIDDKQIGQLCILPIKDLQQWFLNLSLTEHQQQVGKRIFN